jgi:sulfur transfer protein SufE
MTIPESYQTTPLHRELIDELLALDTAEDRLQWLLEREPLHRTVEPAERTEECKVPGCLSGLWLKADIRHSRCFFSAHSDSDLVHGVVSYICDLYSDRSPREILEIGDLLIRSLRLDGLLSTTRKRALSSSLAFFHHTASQHIERPHAG